MNDGATVPYVSIAWAACPRWAVRESADLIDVIEQPGGQTSAVLIDVQGTGASPRRLGNALLLEARSLLVGGVSADLTVHALNQLLHSWRDGRVGAAILVAAIASSRCRAEIASYGDVAVAVHGKSGWSGQELRGVLAGHDPAAAPDLRVQSLDDGTMVVISTDGLARTTADLMSLLADSPPEAAPAEVVNQMIAAAIARDNGRPSADMAAVAFQFATELADVAIERGTVRRPVKVRAAR